MLHKCANPRCSSLFRKMNEGRLFQVPHPPTSRHEKLHRAGIPGVEYFWLCDQCQTFFTLAFRPDSGAMVIPLAGLPTGKTAHDAAESSSTRIPAVPGGRLWNA
jgi:hypothetical protein